MRRGGRGKRARPFAFRNGLGAQECRQLECAVDRAAGRSKIPGRTRGRWRGGGVGLNSIALALVTLLLTDASVQPVPIESHRWKERVLLVFSPAEDDPRLADLDANLEALACAVDNRDLVVYRMAGPAGAGERDLRRAHGIDEDAFVVILIGKDGGEKYRAEGPVDPRDVLGIVDAMPMRRAEAAGDRPCP